MAEFDEDYICLSYVEGACPNRCSFADCDAFKPSTYMQMFINKIKKEI